MQRDRSLRKLLKSATDAGVAMAIFAVPAAAGPLDNGNGNVNGNGCGQVVSEVARTNEGRGQAGITVRRANHGLLVSTTARTCNGQLPDNGGEEPTA